VPEPILSKKRVYGNNLRKEAALEDAAKLGLAFTNNK
jgi:hypothetical protein